MRFLEVATSRLRIAGIANIISLLFLKLPNSETAGSKRRLLLVIFLFAFQRQLKLRFGFNCAAFYVLIRKNQ